MDLPKTAGVTSSGDRAHFSKNVTVGTVQGNLVLSMPQSLAAFPVSNLVHADVSRLADAVSLPYDTSDEHFKRVAMEAESFQAILEFVCEVVKDAESPGRRRQFERLQPVITRCENTLLCLKLLKDEYDALENSDDWEKSDELMSLERRLGSDASFLTASLQMYVSLI